MMQLTSCLSEIADPLCTHLARYLSDKLKQPLQFYDADWSDREAALDSQAVELGWICGLLHVWKEKQTNWPFTPIVAPIMDADRYQRAPVYFADVVVHQDSSFQSLGELAGSQWAYNEDASFSGHHMMLHWLQSHGQDADFFAKRIRSGAHSQSLQLVANGEADCAAIDSTVLDMLTARNPAWHLPLRVVGSLGPYPMPPLVVSNRLPPALRLEIQHLLSNAHEDPQMAHLFSAWGVSRWTAVNEQTYDPIRQLPLNLW